MKIFVRNAEEALSYVIRDYNKLLKKYRYNRRMYAVVFTFGVCGIVAYAKDMADILKDKDETIAMKEANIVELRKHISELTKRLNEETSKKEVNQE